MDNRIKFLILAGAGIFFIVTPNIFVPTADAAASSTIFTAGQSGSWTVPAGATTTIVTMWGGGGSGGAGVAGSTNGAGGGGGGVIYQYNLATTPGESISYSVGSGGVAKSPGNNGAAGGDTTLGPSAGGTTLTAHGGSGGIASGNGGSGGTAHDQSNSATGGTGGAGSAAGGDGGTYSTWGYGGGGGGMPNPPYGDEYYRGGHSYDATHAVAGYGGGGGGSSYGAGGAGSASRSSNASAGTNGGGGGGAWIDAGYTSGAGGGGGIILTYYPNSAPSISSVSDSPDPVAIGSSTTFSVSWSDSGDTIKIHLCKTNSITAPTQTCGDGSWCDSSSFTGTSPATCNYTTQEADAGQTRNYYAFACDDKNSCSSSSSGAFTVNEAETTNISSVLAEHFAWNDTIGWIDFYSMDNIFVSSTQLTGYASSSFGYIALDCATSPNGNICGASDFKISNDGSGNLSGWAWNDVVGWISFDSATAGSAYFYQVTVNPSTGNFSGWAYNDIVGWISFNCSNDSSCGAVDYKVKTSWTTVQLEASLTSSIFDTGAVNGAALNTIMWQGSQPSGTSVKFQIASDNSTSTWSYIGPDGTDTTYYAPSGPGLPTQINSEYHNNHRYFRYKIFLYSNGAQTETPRVDDIIINYSP